MLEKFRFSLVLRFVGLLMLTSTKCILTRIEVFDVLFAILGNEFL
jgi:hypothetical protein